MAFEDLPGLLHHDGELFVCPCGNAEMKVEIDTEPLRFWCCCGEYYTEESVAAQRTRRGGVVASEPKPDPIRLELPNGTCFTCPCGSSLFWEVGDRQLLCMCGHTYTRQADDAD